MSLLRSSPGMVQSLAMKGASSARHVPRQRLQADVSGQSPPLASKLPLSMRFFISTPPAPSKSSIEMPDTYKATADMFSKQAAAYAASETHSMDADLMIMVKFAEPHQGQLVLDVATGPGNTAMAMAESGAQVIATDLAEGMLEAATKTARDRGLTNIIFQRGQAESLAFADDTFHLVVCRIAAHHFQNVPLFVKEVSRVLKRGGKFVLEDSLAPHNPEEKKFLDWLERTRDPTHVHSLSEVEWHNAVKAAGLSIAEETVFKKKHNFASWVSRTGRSKAEIEDITKNIFKASSEIRSKFFTIENHAIKYLHDEKIIFAAIKQ